MRRKLQGSDEGDRQIVKVRSAVMTDGLAAVVLNILSRHRDPPGQRRRS
jgi:hypothetical protein